MAAGESIDTIVPTMEEQGATMEEVNRVAMDLNDSAQIYKQKFRVLKYKVKASVSWVAAHFFYRLLWNLIKVGKLFVELCIIEINHREEEAMIGLKFT